MNTRNAYTKKEDRLILETISAFEQEGKSKGEAFDSLATELDRTKAALQGRYYSHLKGARIIRIKPKVPASQKEDSSFKKRVLVSLFDQLPKEEKEAFLLEKISSI